MEVTLNNAPVYVATGGKDFDPNLPTVLFLHGSGGDHRTWALQTRWFAYHGYSVLAPDLPGHSLSGGKAFTYIEQSGPWLAEFLEKTGVKQAHIVGHSQGFLSALELYKTKPDMCTSVCAIGTAAAIPVNQALIDTAKESSAKAAHMMCNWGFGPSAHQGISSVPGMQPIAISRAIMSQNPLAADLQACADYTGGDDVAAKIDVPRHCILASADKMTPLRSGKGLAEKMGVTPTVIQDYGHMLPLEAPRQTLDALRNFIQSVQVESI
ncbi:alpha/beta fold hydrolase [Hellea balneolensis]|uniref:alpha/beta fold hydrolase n=1 Tax=Hellea balneolensis TaxID=287478 RepID=UPI0003F5F0AD|nr:alpha/beta hydrolase [Hellea balneolensis]